MGWFSKKNEEKGAGEITSLPELPDLPEFPTFKENNKLPKLPTYPNNSFGEKFSQSAIKEAVSGRKEVNLEEEADEFEFDDRMQMMQKPLKQSTMREISSQNEMSSKRIPLTREIDEEYEPSLIPKEKIPAPFVEAARKVKRAEPVFIRIDKFEESMKSFEETKKKIIDIERLLHDIVKVKEEEEKELNDWQNEIQSIKKKIDKIDQDIFSRLE